MEKLSSSYGFFYFSVLETALVVLASSPSERRCHKPLKETPKETCGMCLC